MSRVKWSEFEVQAVAWNILRARLSKNYHVRGEYRIWFEPPADNPSKRDSIRVDIAIISKKNNEITAILQVKRNKTGRIRGKINRINLDDIPVIVIEGMNEAIHVIDTVKSRLPKIIID